MYRSVYLGSRNSALPNCPRLPSNKPITMNTDSMHKCSRCMTFKSSDEYGMCQIVCMSEFGTDHVLCPLGARGYISRTVLFVYPYVCVAGPNKHNALLIIACADGTRNSTWGVYYERSQSSYCFRWFCVRRKNGSLRVVHDLQPLNAMQSPSAMQECPRFWKNSLKDLLEYLAYTLGIVFFRISSGSAIW